MEPQKESKYITPEALGRYKKKKRIGSGGIGVVSIAFDNHILRNIAIKELFYDNEEFGLAHKKQLEMMKTRFLREARITGQLEHPSIVPVYEIGKRENGQIYYTMKLIQGETLTQKIKNEQKTEKRLTLLNHFIDVCNAIAYAHSKSVIHRDLKPDNIMIGEFGETVVIDWGIAKRKEESEKKWIYSPISENASNENTGKTVAGKAFGTPAYMPPEQAKGELDKIDEQSDIYSLGAILYEIIAGHPPFEGKDNDAILTKVLYSEPLSFSELKIDVSHELEAIVQKAMNKNKRLRYKTVLELLSDIRKFMSGGLVAGYNYTSLELLIKFIKKHKIVVTTGFLIFLTILIAFIFSFKAYKKEQESRHLVEISYQKKDEETKRAHYNLSQAYLLKSIEKMEEKDYFSANIFAISSILNNPASENSPFYSKKFTKKFKNAQNLEIKAFSIYINSYLFSKIKLKRTQSLKNDLSSVAISPNKKYYAVGDISGTIWVFYKKNHKEKLVFKAGKNKIFSLKFINNRILVSAGYDKTVKIWDIENGLLIKTLKGHNDKIYSVAFSQKNGLLATGSFDSTVRLWDIKTGKAFILKNKTPVYRVDFSSDGKLLVAGGVKNIFIWDIKTKKQIKTFKGNTDLVFDVKFSPDNKTVVAGSYDRTIRFWNLKTGVNYETLKFKTSYPISLKYSHNGRYLIASFFNGHIKIFDLTTFETLFSLNAHKSAVWNFDLSKDDTEMVSVGYDKKIKFWDSSFFVNNKNFSKDNKFIYDIIFFNNHIIAGTEEGEIVVWNQKAKQLKTIKAHDDIIWKFAKSHKNNKIISVGIDGKVVLTDLKTYKTTTIYKAKDALYCADFSPNDKFVIVGGIEGKAILINIKTKKTQIIENTEKTIWDCSFISQNQVVTAGGNKLITIINTKTKIATQKFFFPDMMSGVKYLKQQKELFAVGKNAILYKIHIDSGKIERFKGHTKWINYITLSKNGKYVATSSDDRKVIIWNAKTGKIEMIFSTPENGGLAFSDSNNEFVFSNGKNARLFKMNLLKAKNKISQKTLEKAKQKAGLFFDSFELKIK